jgi:hypothetical protein
MPTKQLHSNSQASLVLGITNDDTALGLALGSDERETITQTVTSQALATLFCSENGRRK